MNLNPSNCEESRHSRRFPVWLLCLTFFLPLGVHAGNPAAPDGAAVEGSLGGGFGSAITAHMNYVEADLSELRPGDLITGISFRLNDDQGAFAGATFSRFEIRVGKGNDSLTTTFANNFDGEPTLVRSGSLALLSTDFTNAGSPNSFGRVIKFDDPWVYEGGNLLIELRSSAPTGTLVIDTMTDSEGVDGEATFATNADATTATTAIFAHNWAIAFEVTDVSMVTEKIMIPSVVTGEGNSNGTLDQFGGLTSQMQYLSEHLGSLNPGDQIVGIGFRIDGSELPFHSSTFSRFEIALGRASAGYTVFGDPLFADNFASTPTTVRTGPATLYFTVVAEDPNPFMTRPLRFDVPFTYTGGDLLLQTRTSEQTTSVVLDAVLAAGVYGDAVFNVGDDDATVGTASIETYNWPMELDVVRDTKAPRILFRGKSKLKKGTNRVRGMIFESGTVASVQYRSTSGQKGKFSTRSAAHPFSIKVRNQGTKRKIVVKVNATDASGNRGAAKRVLK